MTIAASIKSFPANAWSGITHAASATASAVKTGCQKVGHVSYVCFDSVLPVNPVTKHREFRIMPTSVEIALGSMHYDSLCPKSQISGDEYLNRTVSEVGQRLAAASDRSELPFEFRVQQDDETVNAFCLPGGKVVITTAMIRELRDTKLGDPELDALAFEDRLAGVLGHEITHACAAHGAKRIQLGLIVAAVGGIFGLIIGYAGRQMAANHAEAQAEQRAESRGEKLTESDRARIRATAIAEASGLVEVARSVADLFWRAGAFLFQQKHSRCHEHQSDVVGMRYAHNAGYDARGGIFVQKVLMKVKGESGTRAESVAAILSSHPASADRIERCEDAWAEIQAGNVETLTH